MINQVAIITNFRTGSTSFTLLKAEEYKLPYKAELFAHNRPEPLGRAKRDESRRNAMKLQIEALEKQLKEAKIAHGKKAR